MSERSRPLPPQQESFVMLYVAGDDLVRGNGTRAYLAAYPSCTDEKVAGSSASRLLKKEKVRARIREIRDEAEAESKARLRSWMSMAPTAQDVLDRAMRGELDGTDEQIRSAVNAARETLDRALGSVKHMHEGDGRGPTVNVFVASGTPTEKPAVALVETHGPPLLGTG